ARGRERRAERGGAAGIAVEVTRATEAAGADREDITGVGARDPLGAVPARAAAAARGPLSRNRAGAGATPAPTHAHDVDRADARGLGVRGRSTRREDMNRFELTRERTGGDVRGAD